MMKFRVKQKQVEEKLAKKNLAKQVRKVIEILERERFKDELKNPLLMLIYERYKKAIEILDKDENINKIIIIGGSRAYIDSFYNENPVLLEAMHQAESLLEKYKKAYTMKAEKKRGCHCNLQDSAWITSEMEYNIINDFFSQQLENGIFKSIPIDSPYHIENSALGETQLYADEWYRCLVCGTLWELKKMTSTHKGFVRKFDDGVYCMLKE